MFARFKSHFTRPTASQKKLSGQKTSEVRDNGSYFRPQSADALLATPLRRQCLQQLWQNSTLPEGLYQRFYLAPIKQLLGSVQQVPATPEGNWSGRGGFADLTLQFTTCAVRLAKGHLLPPGAAPETQAAQSVVWQAVVFWAALFYHLPLLRQLEGELEDGHVWQPGWWAPERRFRFRFQVSQTISPAPLEAMMAARLLPEEVVSWLSLVPEAWRCLTLPLGGHPSAVPLMDSLLQEATTRVQSPLLKPVVSPEAQVVTAAAVVSTEPDEVSPPPVPAAVPQGCDDTQTLLSLFQSNNDISLPIDANGNDSAVKSRNRTDRKPKNVALTGSKSSSY
ncbi:TraI domain-containing protein [Xenorhabdus budapestensis]|uniref:Helicase n=1 Tax=Xenorhabdus budapestensis TaxID=290110 RepID=A0A2D0ISC9_XENBU|nr:TraI domain-containing protein [Xenorhabdus budapestensis]PHM24800.1 helicase [Xenorhabdus budapestensis]